MGAPRNVNPIQLDITDDESIEHCFLAVQQHFGKLDVLVNNAGTAAQHLPKDATLRDKFELCMNVNVTSTAVLTERLAPLLEKSSLPKVIFISSTVGSIGTTLKGLMYKGPSYNSSKSAVNALAVYYSKLYPRWKVNSVCPGYRATGLNGAELNEDTDPKLGAIRAAELVAEGPTGDGDIFEDRHRDTMVIGAVFKEVESRSLRHFEADLRVCVSRASDSKLQ